MEEQPVKKQRFGGPRPGALNGMFGKHHSEEHKQHLREALSGDKNGFHGKHHSEATKKLLSELRKGKPGPRAGAVLSEETKRKISEAKRGKRQSAEVRAAQGKARTGKPSNALGCKWNDAMREQLSDSLKSMYASWTPERWEAHRSKLRECSKGRVFSDEWKAKLRESRKMVMLRDGPPLHSSQFKTGVHHSERFNTDIKYQSGYELIAYTLLDLREDVKAYRRSEDAIPYILADGKHNYIPDIHVVWADDTQTVIEIKPEFMMCDPVVIAKHQAAALHYDSLSIQFEVWTEEQLGID